MHWGNPNILYALILIPIFIVVLFFFKKKREKQVLRFCDETLLPFHNKNFSNFYFNLKTFILIIAFLWTIVALARPQWETEERTIETSGQDIVFVIDVSKSMDATDITPTRLERAKQHIELFLSELRSDRVAIVAFAGEAVVVCPMTTDYRALQMLVAALSTDTIGNFGTNIGRAIEKAAEVFQTEARAKTIILLSDGEDHEKRGVEMAKQLRMEGVTIYTIGIGTPGGAPLLLRSNAGNLEYAKDDRGDVITTRVGVEELRLIAEETGGRFYMVTPTFTEIDAILRSIKNNEQTNFAQRQFSRYKEQYHLFLILALIFLMLEGIVNYKNRETI